MFFKDKKKKTDRRAPVAGAPRSIPSIISTGLSVQGDLRTEGNLEIDGEVDGNIYCNIVTVRRGGVVKGNISANEIFIDGNANGMIKGKHIFVSPGAGVSGILFYDTLTVKDGAALNAQCKSLSELNKEKDKAPVTDGAGESEPEHTDDFFEEMTLVSDESAPPRALGSDDFMYSESISGEDDDEVSEESDITAAEYDADSGVYDSEESPERILAAVNGARYRVNTSVDKDEDEAIFGGESEDDADEKPSDAKKVIAHA